VDEKITPVICEMNLKEHNRRSRLTSLLRVRITSSRRKQVA
jgi:hypothetical protein